MRITPSSKIILLIGSIILTGFQQEARSEPNTFENPAVSGVATSLPLWSGFSPVVLQYGRGTVQDVVAADGLQSLELSPDSSVAWAPTLAPAPGSVVMTSMQVRFDSFSSSLPVIPEEELSALLFINDSGLNALNGDTAGSGTWKILRPLSPGVFYEITVIHDYTSQTYDVSVNGIQVGDDLIFKDPISQNTYLATLETSEKIWVDGLSTEALGEDAPPTPNSMTWETPPVAGTFSTNPAPFLSTDFTGRTVSGNSAGNITWITDGVTPPGNLTAVDVNRTGRLAGLFTTAAANNRFIPDLNIDSEGPWSATVGLTLTSPSLIFREIRLDYQHLGNAGTIPIINKLGRLTVSVRGSISGLLGTVSMLHSVSANVGQGSDTFAFNPPIYLDNTQTYSVSILAEGGGSGANIGLDSLSFIKEGTSVVETDTSIRMTATLATHPGAVEYYFECLTTGGHDSGWQVSPHYVDTGLAPGSTYTYRIRARARNSPVKMTEWSPLATATTTGATPSNTFTEWITNFGLNSVDQEPQADPDGDGLPNHLEAWFGTDPSEPNPGLSAPTVNGTHATLTHPINENPVDGLTFLYQWSSDLQNWYATDGVQGPENGITVTTSSTTTAGSMSTTVTSSGAQDHFFLRAVVTQD